MAVFARFNNIARFVFASTESLILGAINRLGSYIECYLKKLSYRVNRGVYPPRL